MLKIASQDCIHQDKRMQVMPELKNIQKIALENGALMSTLSGSGSSFFTLCFEKDAPKIGNLISKVFAKFRVEIFAFDNKGYIISEKTDKF
jgi:homoserine kinase